MMLPATEKTALLDFVPLPKTNIPMGLWHEQMF